MINYLLCSISIHNYGQQLEKVGTKKNQIFKADSILLTTVKVLSNLSNIMVILHLYNLNLDQCQSNGSMTSSLAMDNTGMMFIP